MTRKFTAVLLCVALIISVTPVVAAQSTINDVAQNVVDENINETVEEPYIIGEITEKRTENTKHFLMSDRSIMAAMYNQSVHYEDNGTWVDIDNSFSTNGENDFENKSNSFKTKFSKKSNGNKLVTIKKDNYSLSWMLDDADKVNAQISQSNETETDDISVLKNIQGTVTYPEIQNDVDLQYVVSGEDIKENIILQSADAPTEYSFTYKFNKLKYRTNNDNQIEFYDENAPEDIVFIIDAPYMYDSAQAYSNNIEMQISENSNGFTLKLIPDKDWLLSEDRVFPIVIDPTTLSSQDAWDIWDITLYNAWAAAYNYNRAEILVGSNTSSNVYRTLLKFEKLPDIGTGGIVVNAKMYLTRYYYYSEDITGLPTFLPRPTDDIQVNVHRVTSLWPETNPTWSEHAKNYNSIVEDYFIYNDTDDCFTADITNLVNDWYNGSANYGVMLKADDETAANHVMQFASSDFPPAAAKSRPILTVNYRTCIGLEDYWSYTTQDMGGYGTGYVNNYNGNLTYVHDDASFNSLINGFTLSHVYNSANSSCSTGRYGNGWGLNLVQTVEPASRYPEIKDNPNVRYVYTDGDGTKHYFVETGGTTVDEDGLGYTLTTIDEATDSGNTILRYKITTKDDVVLKFDEWYALRRIIDTNGNTIYLNYSPVPNQFNYLSSITTSSGGVFALKYDSNYVLTSITDNAGRVTNYSYSDGNLTKITYQDGTDLDFTYCSEDNGVAGSTSWLQCVTLPNDFKYCYENHNDGKISSVVTKSSSNAWCDELYFTYSNQQTTVRKLQLRYITYQFDTFGRVTCAYDSQGNSYSETYEPTSTDKNKIFSNNKLSNTSNNKRYINNLIANPAFADGLSYWSQYKEAPDETEISVVSDQAFISSKSVKISSTASSIQALLQAPITTSGKTYTLSANIKTENVVSATHGATVEIVKSTPNGNCSCFCDLITGTTDPEINDGFVTVRVTVTLASGESIARIGVGLYNASGTVWINSIQFEEGDTANKINLISNSSFEKGSVTGFTTNFGSSTGNGASTTKKQSGSYSCKIAGYSSQTRGIYQRVNISGKAGDVYSFGGWGMATSIPITYSTLAKKPNFRMYLKAYNGSTVVESFEAKFNEHITDWQYVSKTVVLNEDYTMLEVLFTYDYNCNTAYFDDMFLYRDTAQSYKYDENGNVISTSDYAKQQSSFEYTNNNLTALINPDGTSYEYTYDSKNNLTDAESNIGVKYHMTYDSSGNALTSEITSTDSNSSEKITSSATYQNSGNYPSTVTDSLGNTTTYTYDTARGLQTGVTDAKGNVTEYEYNSLNDRLNSVTSGDSNVTYTYDTVGRLCGIETPSATRYAFVYDEFGNTKTVSIGSQKLTENYYDTSRGLLTHSVYGNGQKIGFTYDILDRVTEKLYNDVVKVKFRYDKFGNLYEKQDLFTNTTYRYNYDLSGRITGVVGSDNTSLNYVYDEFNRIEKYITKFDDNSNITEYIYGDSDISGQKNGLIYGVKQNDTQRISYNYDNLARLNTRTLNTTTPFVTQYTYHQGATENTTTTLVKTVQNGSDTYEYTYDSLGNITQIKLNDEVYESYTYDALSQLATVTRGSDVYTYTYDNGGNIQTVKRNGNTAKGFTYDDTWTDLLISYNGMSIEYDEIGNPTSYWDGSTLTWSNGRQLTSVSYGAYTIQYGYNADGLRTTKNDSGVITEYYWLDGLLLGEKTGDDYIIYLYDENGTPYGFVNNNTYYYYVQNAQGDIVGILDADGNTIVQYTYSAWGETRSITGSKATTIGRKNPLRYRGYYYDSETGFYYLQSRYYDPVTCRFLNADGAYDTNQGVLGYNMYAYCLNNPVNMYDPDGRCSRFLGFLWKIDCKQASCPESKNYVKPKTVDPIGTYNKGQGYVYIVKEDLLDEIMEDKEDNVVVILDNRSASDPNMQIQDSYRITKNKQQKEIAQLMLDYNTSNPVEPAWSRTLDSLVEEWKLHNFAYSWGIKRERTADCDFNNADEGMGFWDFVGR